MIGNSILIIILCIQYASIDNQVVEDILPELIYPELFGNFSVPVPPMPPDSLELAIDLSRYDAILYVLGDSINKNIERINEQKDKRISSYKLAYEDWEIKSRQWRKAYDSTITSNYRVSILDYFESNQKLISKNEGSIDSLNPSKNVLITDFLNKKLKRQKLKCSLDSITTEYGTVRINLLRKSDKNKGEKIVPVLFKFSRIFYSQNIDQGCFIFEWSIIDTYSFSSIVVINKENNKWHIQSNELISYKRNWP